MRQEPDIHEPFSWEKHVVKPNKITASRKKQTSLLLILVLFYVLEDERRGRYVQSTECFLFFSILNSPQGAMHEVAKGLILVELEW